MPESPADITPPDDSGSATTARFIYQAQCAVPFCIDCVSGGDVKAVFVEHIEDIALECVDGWRFLQVKTREGWLRGWRFVDLVGEGGGLRSLYRTHLAVRDVVSSTTYELLLEGACDPNDDLVAKLREPATRASAEVCSALAGALGCGNEEAADFLGQVRIYPDQPPKSSIVDRNLRIIGEKAGHLPATSIIEIHGAISQVLIDAMQADRLGGGWAAVMVAGRDEGPQHHLVEAKMLTREKLMAILPDLQPVERTLLKRVLNLDAGPLSALEEKLRAGGASDAVVNDAKMLRASAVVAETRHLAATVDDAQLDDVRGRVEVLVHAEVEAFAAEKSPAAKAWARSLEAFTQSAHYVDPLSIFGQDPFLLIGEACELSDLCRIGWGLSRA